jgi:hypothetical protein
MLKSLLMSLSPLPPRSMDSSSSESPDAALNGESAPSQPRKPIPRKGHTKSRRGCFNCKRRRIKCNERHPQCNHCIKAGLKCEYPANIIQSGHRTPSIPSPQELVHLRSTPGTFVSSRLAYHLDTVSNTLTDYGRYALVPPLSDHGIPSSSRWCG